MKMNKMIVPFALLIILATACSENKTAGTTETKETTETTTEKTTTVAADSIKKEDGVNVSIKGTSIDISGKEGKVETKSGTDIQVNKKGVDVKSKDVRVKVGNLP